MNKAFALLIAASFVAAGAAHAQSNPPGAPVPPNTPGIATGKAERAAEARKQSKPAGRVLPPGGDEPRTPEGGAIGTDRAAVAGEARAETRDQRRPGKPRTTQGATPK